MHFPLLSSVLMTSEQVQGVEQVLGPEEEVAIDEFAKFVRRLSEVGRVVELTQPHRKRDCGPRARRSTSELALPVQLHSLIT